MDSKIEINKRFGMPFFIPLISLVCCFLLASRKDTKMYNLNKYIYFFIAFFILVSAEITVRYSGISWNHTFVYYLIPILMLLGIGKVPGLIAVCIYAIPPIIRLTNLGIREVDKESLEAFYLCSEDPTLQ